MKQSLEMSKRLIEILEKNEAVGKGDVAEAIQIFNRGWEALEDGRVILTSGDLVAVKQGSSIVKYKMLDFNVRDGLLDGNIDKEVGAIDVPNEKKNEYLAQAIITKYYTIKKGPL